MTLSSNIGNHAILSSDIYLGVSSMNQMINQNQFLTENSYTKLKNDHDLKVPFTGYAYSNSSIMLTLVPRDFDQQMALRAILGGRLGDKHICFVA